MSDIGVYQFCAAAVISLQSAMPVARRQYSLGGRRRVIGRCHQTAEPPLTSASRSVSDRLHAEGLHPVISRRP